MKAYRQGRRVRLDRASQGRVEACLVEMAGATDDAMLLAVTGEMRRAARKEGLYLCLSYKEPTPIAVGFLQKEVPAVQLEILLGGDRCLVITNDSGRQYCFPITPAQEAAIHSALG